MKDMSARAAQYGRKIDFGMRIHVIVRESEDEAKAYTKKLMSKFDAEMGKNLKIEPKTQNQRVLCGKMNFVKWRMQMILSSRCCGQVSAERAQVAAGNCRNSRPSFS